jgi:uncharacterized membrane protein YgcG
MGSDSILGLLFQISADPSQAQAAISQFEQSTSQSLQRTTGQFQSMGGAISPLRYSVRDLTDEVDKGLLSNRETVRLLSEELGVHMPRAVTSAIGELIPAIGGLGTALLAVFAIEEIPKFIQGIHDTADEMAGFGKEAKKAFEGAIEASDKALTHFKTIKEGIKLQDEVNRNIAALSVQRDVLESTGGVAVNWARAVYDMMTGNAAAAAADMAMARMEKMDMADLARLEDQRTEQLNTRKELEDTAHRKRIHDAEEKESAEEAIAKQNREVWKESHDEAHKWLHEYGLQRLEVIKIEKQAQGEVRQDLALSIAQNGVLSDGNGAYETRNRLELTYLHLLEEIDGVQQRQAALARSAGPGSSNTITQTNQLTEARQRQITVTQELRAVEAAFSQALAGELGPLESLTQQAADAAGEFAQMIGGTKAAAEVRGAFDAALSIEHMAAFIASHGTDFAELMSSIQYGLASAEMFGVAGRGGSRSSSGGGGGGTQSSYGRGGGGGGGSGSGGGGRGASTPGTLHVTFINNGALATPSSMRQFISMMAPVASQMVVSGQVQLSASNAMRNGAKQS